MLFNVKDDPFERQPLSLEDNAEVLKELKTLIMEEYPMTTFPSYHQNVEEALPGNNDGNRAGQQTHVRAGPDGEGRGPLHEVTRRRALRQCPSEGSLGAH